MPGGSERSEGRENRVGPERNRTEYETAGAELEGQLEGGMYETSGECLVETESMGKGHGPEINRTED
jgi:hypothetical protein